MTTVGEVFTNTQAAPTPLLSVGAADQRGVAFGGERDARAEGAFAGLFAAFPVSFSPCCAHVVPERVNTHAAPVPSLSSGRADQRGVCLGGQRHACAEFARAGLAAAAVSFSPCWVHFSARAREHPRRADCLRCRSGRRSARCCRRRRAPRLLPNSPAPVSPLPVSFSPCWVHVSARAREHPSGADAVLSVGPPISAVLPSEESATLAPNSPAPVSPPLSRELFALLGPFFARAREHPRRADFRRCRRRSADQRGVRLRRRAPRWRRIRPRRSRRRR